MTAPIRLEWTLETSADLQSTWSTLSDTDRFNLVAAMGFEFSEEPLPDGTRARTGRLRRFGMTMTWEEAPFRWRAPRWFQSTRRFHRGLLAQMVLSLTLAPLETAGTRVTYAVELHPRSFAARPMIALDAATRIGPALERALRAAIASLSSATRGADFGAPPPPLSQDADRLLTRAARAPLMDAHVFDRLVRFLRRAPLREQALLSPIHLSELFGLPLDRVLTALVECVDAGVLALRFDILCPSCGSAEPLPRSTDDAHCPSCNVRFDRSFPNAVVVHFQPTSAVRPATGHVECLGSPARTPDVVAQDVVDPGARVDLGVTLEAGTYELRTLPPQGPPVMLLVYEDVSPTSTTFVARPHRVTPPSARVLPGPCPLHVENTTQTPLVVSLERLQRPLRHLTAGIMWEEFPQFRAYFPTRYFSRSVAYSGTVLALLDPLHGEPPAVAYIRDARVIYRSRRATLAVFETREQAYDVLGRLLPMLTSEWVGVGEGPIWESQMGDRVVPLGRAVEEAISAMHGAGPGNVALATQVWDRPEVERALDVAGVTTETASFAGAHGEPLRWARPSRGARVTQ